MTRGEFLVVTAEREPRRDPLVRPLCAGLAQVGAARVWSCGPSSWDVLPGGRLESARSLRAAPAFAGPAPAAAAAMDSEAVRALGRGRLLGARPWAVVSRAPGALDADALELAYGAAAIWSLHGLSSWPRGLRARVAAARPRDLSDARWLRRRLDELASPPARQARLPLTSIVIPVHGALPLLRECLASLRRHTAAPHEIILVDNGSDAAVKRWLRALRGVRLIENARNLGFARAVNQGMRAARGGYIAWVNSDTRVTPGWLEGLAGALRSDPELGAVGPVTNRIAGAALVPVPPGFKPSRRGVDALGAAYALKNRGQVAEAHRLTGFFLLLRRPAVESVGLLDERFGLGCYEDYDYCLRLRQAGFKLAVARDVFVYHSYHGSFASDESHRRQLLDNRRIFIDKWCAKALDFLDHLDPTLASS